MNSTLKYNRILFIFISLFLLISCKKQQQNTTADISKNQDDIKMTPLPSAYKLSTTVNGQVASWSAFKSFEAEIQNLRETNEEYLLPVIQELLVKEKELSTSSFPNKFENAAVKSRLVVIKTLVLKTEAAINDREEKRQINDLKINILLAYNSLLKQFEEVNEENIADEFLNEQN